MISDHESQLCLQRLIEDVKPLVEKVQTILVVLPSVATFDVPALQAKIAKGYPQAGVFFLNPCGTPFGACSPGQVDLLVDLSAPQERQPFFLSRKLRKKARFAVGRKADRFRSQHYDRVVDEPTQKMDWLESEAYAQRAVLAASGVRLSQSGAVGKDLGSFLFVNPLHKK